jgi:hypothetical protein
VTNRDRRALHGIFVLLLVVTTVVFTSGPIGQAINSALVARPVRPTTEATEAAAQAPITESPPPSPQSEDDPRLNMLALFGLPPVRVPISTEPSRAPATRWLKNMAATTLWSGANSRAAAFTDLPAESYLRVSGPEDNGRWPVYYAGDGLLRRAGNGWVESAAVETVEAPTPGQVPSVDQDANQPLPVWVEAFKSTTLWSGPDEKAVILTDLPQWAFLNVDGLERTGRLLVKYAGDFASRQAGIGWVEQSAVGPSGDPGVWVTNHRATTLWSGIDDNAVRFTDLPQWSKLRVVLDSLADADRMQVEFFGDGATRLPGVAWVARADIGPITPPVPLPSNATPPARIETHTFASGNDFINTVGEAAQRARKATRVPASVTVAQAILESDWGRSRLARQGNNLFGIKALGSATGPAGVVSLGTWEVVNDSNIMVQAPFKAYYTLQQSIDDHASFLTRNRRYAAALTVGDDAQAFARAIQDAGYATDPSYASKLIGLMDRYNLYRFDN